MGIITAAIFVAVFAHLNQLRRQSAIAAVDNDTRNLAIAVEQNVSRTLATVEVAIRNLSRDWLRRDVPGFDFAQEANFVAKDLNFANIVQLGIIGPNGILVYSSLGLPDQPVSLVDHEHFTAHLDKTRETDQIFVSRPLTGRVSKIKAIQISSGIYDDKDQFAGVVVASIDANKFVELFGKVSLGTDGAISLIGLDGYLRARAPVGENADRQFNVRITDRPFLLPNAPDTGNYHSRPSDRSLNPGGQFDRIAGFSRVDKYPLVVVALTTTRDVEAKLDREAQVFGWITAAASGVVILIWGLGGLVVDIDRRRRRYKEVTEDRWRAAIDDAGQGLFDYHVQTGAVFYSPTMTKLFGLDDNGMDGKPSSWDDLLHPDDQFARLAAIANGLRDRTRNVFDLRCRARHADGSWR